jgi:hypothetical protein
MATARAADHDFWNPTEDEKTNTDTITSSNVIQAAETTTLIPRTEVRNTSNDHQINARHVVHNVKLNTFNSYGNNRHGFPDDAESRQLLEDSLRKKSVTLKGAYLFWDSIIISSCEAVKGSWRVAFAPPLRNRLIYLTHLIYKHCRSSLQQHRSNSELIKVSQEVRTTQREVPDSLLSKIKVKTVPKKRPLTHSHIIDDDATLRYEAARHYIPRAPLGAGSDLKKSRLSDLGNSDINKGVLQLDPEEEEAILNVTAHLSFKEKLVDFLM